MNANLDRIAEWRRFNYAHWRARHESHFHQSQAVAALSLDCRNPRRDVMGN